MASKVCLAISLSNPSSKNDFGMPIFNPFKSLFRDFSQKSLKFLYSRKSNLLLINILRAAFFTLLIIAISGPRWNYHEIESKQTIVNNLILLFALF